MHAIANNQIYPHQRSMEFLFEHVPVKINGDQRVESVTFNTPNGEKTIDCGLVVTAIGYQINGSEDVPIDLGKVVNHKGYVAENLFVVGWAKRGPSGVIGTNKSDAADVMNLLVSKLSATPKAEFDLNSMLHARVVSQPIWEMINTAEISAGEALGKPRLKAVSREDLLGLGGI